MLAASGCLEEESFEEELTNVYFICCSVFAEHLFCLSLVPTYKTGSFLSSGSSIDSQEILTGVSIFSSTPSVRSLTETPLWKLQFNSRINYSLPWRWIKQFNGRTKNYYLPDGRICCTTAVNWVDMHKKPHLKFICFQRFYIFIRTINNNN